MGSLGISAIVLVLVFSGGLLGMHLRGLLPEHHLRPESVDVIKLSTGLIGTVAALVLGLLISSAKTSYDRINNELVDNASKIILLDRLLADYGPEAKQIRLELKREFSARVTLLTSRNSADLAKLETAVSRDPVSALLQTLEPRTDEQRNFKARAFQMAGDLSSTRTLLILHKNGSLPMTVVAVLVIWLFVIFTAFGLLGGRNGTAVAALFLGALAVSGAIMLILEMDRPFTGIISISSAPLQDAIGRLGQ